MSRTSRIVMMAAAFVFAAGSVASANTVELTLTVPLKLTLPTSPTSPAWEAAGGTARRLKPFSVNCVIGSGLGYATGAGAQGTIVGQGSSITNGGSQTVYAASGQMIANPSATVVITYDDGNVSTTGSAVGATKVPSGYLCWVQWTTAIPSIAPLFVQGTLAAK
jgi:hypothetical protein